MDTGNTICHRHYDLGMELSTFWSLCVIILKLTPQNPVLVGTIISFYRTWKTEIQGGKQAQLWGGDAGRAPQVCLTVSPGKDWCEAKIPLPRWNRLRGNHLAWRSTAGALTSACWGSCPGLSTYKPHNLTHASSLLQALGSLLVKREQPQCLPVRMN